MTPDDFVAKNDEEQRWWDSLTWNEKQEYVAKLRRDASKAKQAPTSDDLLRRYLKVD